MAGDDLFFQRTGEETRPFVLVRLRKASGDLEGVATIEGPQADGVDRSGVDMEGDLGDVLRDAQEHAALTGLDLRVDVDGNEWPPHLGILGNADR